MSMIKAAVQNFSVVYESFVSLSNTIISNKYLLLTYHAELFYVVKCYKPLRSRDWFVMEESWGEHLLSICFGTCCELK